LKGVTMLRVVETSLTVKVEVQLPECLYRVWLRKPSDSLESDIQINGKIYTMSLLLEGRTVEAYINDGKERKQLVATPTNKYPK